MPYQILIERSVVKYLKRIPVTDYYLTKSKIQSVANNPRPHGSLKLKGREAYRIRDRGRSFAEQGFAKLQTLLTCPSLHGLMVAGGFIATSDPAEHRLLRGFYRNFKNSSMVSCRSCFMILFSEFFVLFCVQDNSFTGSFGQFIIRPGLCVTSGQFNDR